MLTHILLIFNYHVSYCIYSVAYLNNLNYNLSIHTETIKTVINHALLVFFFRSKMCLKMLETSSFFFVFTTPVHFGLMASAVSRLRAVITQTHTVT